MTKRELAKLVKTIKAAQKDVQDTLEQLRGEDLDDKEELPSPDTMAEFLTDLNEQLESENLADLAEDVTTLGSLLSAAEDALDGLDDALSDVLEVLEEDDAEENEEPES